MEIADEGIRRLIADLEDWANWQKGYFLRLGFKSRSAVIVSGGASMSFEEMCEGADNIRCEVLDTMVDDLPPAQKQAIHRRYLHSVYRFPRNNYPEMLAEAHEALLRSGSVRGLW